MEFVAGVSHELRTPLAVICSAAENLADGVIDSRDQIKRYGGLIRDEGRRLTGMVEQVLEFAGAQSGRKNYELRPTELTHVIEDAITACHLQLAEGDFEIERKIAPNLPAVKADAAALSRAIQNLLNNAMKYGGGGRWIGLSAELVRTSAGEEIQINVLDRGLGIAPSEQERVFEPFYRGKEAQAAQIRGNGLGLSLVKHIVDAHGGRVSVESKVGQGSRFTLRLPVSTVAGSPAMNNGESEYGAQSQFKTGT
jgi:signal transduction histidine kinase